MSARSICPDFASLEVAWDAWSKPFWQAASERTLVMPRCGACGTFRWPVGPFCPECHAQSVEWLPPGQGSIYSFTILPVPGAYPTAAPSWRVPVLVEFADAPGVRLVSVLIDAPLDAIAIGDVVEPDWRPAANAKVPVFRLAVG
ncbi:MAG: OB-fold domain-containing protein [Novosphingobium sp.]|nr:OB-fold domain-containing protein [Novosphingobium sp.]